MNRPTLHKFLAHSHGAQATTRDRLEGREMNIYGETVVDIVSNATREHERADVYANRNPRAVLSDLAPRLKYISWESYAAMGA